MIFSDYAEIAAPAEDVLREKWQRVHPWVSTGDVPTPASLSLADLEAYNASVNRMIAYKAEENGEDTWQTPQETLDLRTGDCEDYAILKYAGLSRVMPESDLYLVVGIIKGFWPQPHAFLAARVENRWRILDMKFDQLIGPEDYINWEPVAGFTGTTVVLFAKPFTISDVTHAS